MPSIKRSRSARGRVPLADEIESTGILKNRTKRRKSIQENEDSTYLDTKSSRKILKIAQDLADEEASSHNKDVPVTNAAFDLDSRFVGREDDDLGDDEAPEAWEHEDYEGLPGVVSTHLTGATS